MQNLDRLRPSMETKCPESGTLSKAVRTVWTEKPKDILNCVPVLTMSPRLRMNSLQPKRQNKPPEYPMDVPQWMIKSTKRNRNFSTEILSALLPSTRQQLTTKADSYHQGKFITSPMWCVANDTILIYMIENNSNGVWDCIDGGTVW